MSPCIFVGGAIFNLLHRESRDYFVSWERNIFAWNHLALIRHLRKCWLISLILFDVKIQCDIFTASLLISVSAITVDNALQGSRLSFLYCDRRYLLKASISILFSHAMFRNIICQFWRVMKCFLPQYHSDVWEYPGMPRRANAKEVEHQANHQMKCQMLNM